MRLVVQWRMSSARQNQRIGLGIRWLKSLLHLISRGWFLRTKEGFFLRGETRNEKIERHTKPFLTLLYILHLENLGLGPLVGRHDYHQLIGGKAGICGDQKTYNFAENGIVMSRETREINQDFRH